MATSLRQSWVREETEDSTSGVLQRRERQREGGLGKGSPRLLFECVGAAIENNVVR